jgi:motility quorum-sensing regulator/GCU-specific mRNA interferase toxin
MGTMEKRKPTYDLKSIKSAFPRVKSLGLATTATAFRGAQDLGLSRADMIDAIQVLRPSEFYKSMTSYTDPRIWQDVYRPRFRDTELYVKFTVKPGGEYLLLSFKKR